MIIWSGFGFVVFIIIVISLVLTDIGLSVATGNENFYQENGWAKLLALSVAAVLTFLLHLVLTAVFKPKVMVDKETGKEVKVGGNHSLFFIPVKYWPVVLVVAGVVLMFTA